MFCNSIIWGMQNVHPEIWDTVCSNPNAIEMTLTFDIAKGHWYQSLFLRGICNLRDCYYLRGQGLSPVPKEGDIEGFPSD